ncbi:MAG: hypothetical protein RLO51_24550 [Thalassobaculum sp.]|uniref:hypothetical protein n=1 Tax=Thalassobaculum sp. TaxID=2022740 RepID=UPI0032EBE0FC
MLANCIGEVLGIRTEAYRNLLRASASDNPLDLHLAQLSFDALDGRVRTEIWRRVQAADRRTVGGGRPGDGGADVLDPGSGRAGEAFR